MESKNQTVVKDSANEEKQEKKPVLKSIPSDAYPRLCVSYITAFSPEEDAGSYEIQGR